jgi:transcriptional repressor NrdR
MTVIKRNGRCVPFDCDKLTRSIELPATARGHDRIDAREQHPAAGKSGESEINSQTVEPWHGKQAVRRRGICALASVYKNFREARDFEIVLGELTGELCENGATEMHGPGKDERS